MTSVIIDIVKTKPVLKCHQCRAPHLMELEGVDAVDPEKFVIAHNRAVGHKGVLIWGDHEYLVQSHFLRRKITGNGGLGTVRVSNESGYPEIIGELVSFRAAQGYISKQTAKRFTDIS